MLQIMLAQGMVWVILFVAAVGIVVFIERFLYCHRAQINSAEFLNGVRTVLKRDNVVEALSICEATPGPVARLVKTAILHRDQSRDRLQETVQVAGDAEVPRLEEKLNLLATLTQLAPLLGLLGTVLGFIDIFRTVEGQGVNAHLNLLSGGVWAAMTCAAAGLAVAIPLHAAHNYLVNRVNIITLEMERTATEIVNILTDAGDNGNGSPPV